MTADQWAALGALVFVLSIAGAVAMLWCELRR